MLKKQNKRRGLWVFLCRVWRMMKYADLWSQGTTETSRSYTTHALTVTYAHTAESKKPNIGMNEPHIVVHIQYYIQ